MKWVKYYALLVLLFVFQTVLGDNIRIFGVIPDVIFALAICIALKEERFKVLVFALAAGLLKDFTLMRTFGLNALMILYIAFLVSYISEKFLYPTILVNGICTFCTTLLYQGAYFFFNFVMWGHNELAYPIMGIIIPECIYNTILSFGVFFIVTWLSGESTFNSLKIVRRGSK